MSHQEPNRKRDATWEDPQSPWKWIIYVDRQGRQKTRKKLGTTPICTSTTHRPHTILLRVRVHEIISCFIQQCEKIVLENMPTSYVYLYISHLTKKGAKTRFKKKTYNIYIVTIHKTTTKPTALSVFIQSPFNHLHQMKSPGSLGLPRQRVSPARHQIFLSR